MTFCPSSTATFSNTELNALYTGQSAVLPSSSPSSSDRLMDEPKLLKQDYLDRLVEGLYTRKVIPAEPTLASAAEQDTVIADYRDKLNTLKSNLQEEYCFYNARYKFAIQRVISDIANATEANASNGSINTMLDTCVLINQRLKDLTQIISAITVFIGKKTKSLNSDINSLNGELSTYFSKLNEQARILKSEAPTAEIRKRMVEYTREKAKATNNLLSLYFFLDVVALGMLFYVYKAA